MKKINLLLLACFAFATTITALPWPSDYSFAGGIYGAVPDVPDDYVKQQGTAMNLVGETDIMPAAGNATAFESIYGSIPDELEYSLGKLREGTTDNPIVAQPYDGVGVFKTAYDANSIYVFFKYAHKDNSAMTEGSNLEVMFCPYDRLEYDGNPGAGNEGYLWLRYLELGGIKVNVLNKGSVGTFNLGGYMGAKDQGGASGVIQEDSTTFANSYYTGLATAVSCGTSSAAKIALKLDFGALKGRAASLANEIPFTLEAWKAACEGKGISFEVKFTLDNGNESGAGTKRSYMWNNGNNNVYFNNAYAGYLAPGDKEDDPGEVAAESAAVKSLSIVGNQIVLEQAANVYIYNYAGILVKSANNATNVPISGFAPGIYIVNANGESVKFVVK